ncbi:MAG: hypothetical protein ABIZ04_00450 [Opitutus sp.]
MSEELNGCEVCTVCGTRVARERACHLYQHGTQLTLCGPACVQDFLSDSRALDPVASTHHGLLDGLLSRLRWQNQ